MMNFTSFNPTSSIKVLLVEDNHISRQLMSDFLIDCGYNVLSLAEAGTFTSAMTCFHPDVVLLDLKLPDGDGYTLLSHLQEKPEWRNIPVIVVSAFAFRVDQQRALELGARRYLVKPVKLNEVMQVIQEEVACSLV